MATYDLEEQEKLDELKAWWKRWGSLAMFGAAALVAAAAGWQWWQSKQAGHAVAAASAYEKLAIAIEKKDDKTARDIGAALKQDFADTAFAPRAALVLARLAVVDKKPEDAKKELEWAAAHTAAEPGLRDIAMLRLASVLYDAKDYDGALKLLGQPHDPEFKARFEDLRGDILISQGKVADANKAYEASLAALKPDSPYRQLVEVKRDSTR